MAAGPRRRRWQQQLHRAKFRARAALHRRFRTRHRAARGRRKRDALVTWGLAFFVTALLLGLYSAGQGLDLPRATLVMIERVTAWSGAGGESAGEEPETVPVLSRVILTDVIPLYEELGPEPPPRLSWRERLRRAAEWTVGWVPGGSTSALASTLPYLSRRLSPSLPRLPRRSADRADGSAAPVGRGVGSTESKSHGAPTTGAADPQALAGREETPGRDGGVVRTARPPADEPPARPDHVPGVPTPTRPPDASATAGTSGRLTDRIQQTGPLVLVYHSHTSEMYRTESFAPVDPDAYHRWNTTDTGIVRVGERLVRTLRQEHQIAAVHSKTIHDYPVHAYAYAKSEKTVRTLLEQYPSIEVVIDLHRDGVESSLTVEVEGRETARVALVLATATRSNLSHPGWRRNEAFSKTFELRIRTMYPAMYRRTIRVDTVRYNQQLHPRSILVEIGSYGTDLEAALRAAERLADVLASLLDELPSLSEARSR